MNWYGANMTIDCSILEQIESLQVNLGSLQKKFWSKDHQLTIAVD